MARERPLTVDEALWALYFDFESIARSDSDELPTVLGSLYSDLDAVDELIEVRTVAIVDPDLWEFSGGRVSQGGGGLYSVARGLEEEVERLVCACEQQDRFLVSWSEFDLKLIRKHCSTDLAERAAFVHANAIATARAWRRACRPGLDLKRGQHKLRTYARELGFHVPDKYGENTAAPGISVAKRAAAMGLDLATMDSEDRAVWKTTLSHNCLDCGLTRDVVQRCAIDLENARGEQS